MSSLEFDRAAALADLCRLLAACYYEPGPEFTEERLFDSIIDATLRIDPPMVAKARQLKAAFESESSQNLLVDYAHLFLGPVGTLALPYESAWLNKESESPVDATQALLNLFEDGGFAVDAEFRDLPDHIAVELEFLYTVLFRMAAAIRNQDQQDLDNAAALRWNVLEQHLGRWIDDFHAAVQSGAQTCFYRELVDLTVLFVSIVRDK